MITGDGTLLSNLPTSCTYYTDTDTIKVSIKIPKEQLKELLVVLGASDLTLKAVTVDEEYTTIDMPSNIPSWTTDTTITCFNHTDDSSVV